MNPQLRGGLATIKTIGVTELYELCRQRPVDLIDVRTPEEFRDGRALAARNVPLDTLDPHLVMGNRQAALHEPLYLICQIGGRSAIACAMLMAAGYPNVVNVEGGTDAWSAAGLPTDCA